MIHHRLTLTLVLAALAATALLPAIAAATPAGEQRAAAQRIRQQIAAFDAQLGAVVEQYNQATEDLTAVKAQIKKNAKALKVAKEQLSVACQQLDARVVAIYKERPIEMLDVALAAASFEEIASQLDLMRRVARHDTDLIAAATSSREQIRQKRKALGADRTEASRLVAAVADRKADIEVRLAERHSLLRGVEDEIRQLERAEEEAARQAAEAAVAEATSMAESAASVGDAGVSSATPTQPPIDSGGPSATPAQPPASSGGSSTTPAQRPVIADVGAPGRPQVVAIAAQYLGVPYRYGGTSPQTGFDCSGFVQFVYARAGISLPRTSMTQQQIGRRVSMSALAPGDLVFRGFPAYHVGIYVGGGQAIHSPRTGYSVCYQSISYWTSAVRP